MDIQKASSKEIVEVIYILESAVMDFASSEEYYLTGSLPSRDKIVEDVEAGNVFFIKETGVARGLMSLKNKDNNQLKSINWSDPDDKTLIVDYIIIHSSWKGSEEVGTELLAYAKTYATENGFTSIRVAIPADSTEIRQIAEKSGYATLGEYQSIFQEKPHFGYELSV